MVPRTSTFWFGKIHRSKFARNYSNCLVVETIVLFSHTPFSELLNYHRVWYFSWNLRDKVVQNFSGTLSSVVDSREKHWSSSHTNEALLHIRFRFVLHSWSHFDKSMSLCSYNLVRLRRDIYMPIPHRPEGFLRNSLQSS